MAISVIDTSYVNGSGALSPGNTYTFTHNGGTTEDNRLLVLHVYYGGGTLSGITYAGDSLTKVLDNGNFEVWILADPATGNNTLDTNADRYPLHAVAYTLANAAQSSVIDNSDYVSHTGVGSGGFTQNLTTGDDDSIILDMAYLSSNYVSIETPQESGQTAAGVKYSSSNVKVHNSYREVGTAGSYAMSWSSTTSFNQTTTVTHQLVSIVPAVTSVEYTKANSVKADIKRTSLKTDLIDFNLSSPLQTYSKANSVKANIVNTNTKANSVKASIVATGQQPNSVKAFIFGEGNFGNSVKANIITPNLTKDNSVIGDIEGQIYTRVNTGSLPADDTDLAIRYSNTEIENVATSDDVRVDIDGAGYIIHQFKDHQTSVRDITVVWEGQVGTAPTTSTVYLQVYNHTSGLWETIDSDNTSNASEDFILTGSLGGTLSDYFDSNNFTSFRVYQQN